MNFQQALDHIRQNGRQIAQAAMYGNANARWVGIHLLTLAETPDDALTQEQLIMSLCWYIAEQVQA